MDLQMRCNTTGNTREQAAAVYLRHIHWSQTAQERSPEGRRRSTPPAAGDTGGCTHSYKGWVLRRRKQKNITVRYSSIIALLFYSFRLIIMSLYLFVIAAFLSQKQKEGQSIYSVCVGFSRYIQTF